jgi:outer membrane protein
MRCLRALCSSVALWLFAASIPVAAGAAEQERGLAETVRQALEANLDLAAQRRALAADREQIPIARSKLLPQIDVGARAQLLDADRPDGDRGNNSKESVTLSAGVTQVLYDETLWSEFSSQKHVYSEQAAQFESFRLGVVQQAANAFLELDRARALLAVEKRNRDLTARNLETSRARIAAGYSSEREVLRWESQLAANDSAVVQADTEVIVNRFELNRLRNQPAEALITPLPTSLEEYGFVYGRKGIAEAIAKPEGDRRLRDFMVGVGLARSPQLTAIDASIAAEKRLLTSSKRSFWVPSLSLGAGVNYLAAHGSGNAGPNFNEAEWMVGAGLTFPLLEGGAKFAELRQTRESLSGLRIQRRSTAQSVDQGIRGAFARASGAYTNVGFAREQEAAARRDYELVNQSYILGVASIIDLLDSQSQLLSANQAVTNALYSFLEALITAEEQMALYPFLEPEPEMAELLDRVERQLQGPP